jgi:superfamily II DNA or RNA helicase
MKLENRSDIRAELTDLDNSIYEIWDAIPDNKLFSKSGNYFIYKTLANYEFLKDKVSFDSVCQEHYDKIKIKLEENSFITQNITEEALLKIQKTEPWKKQKEVELRILDKKSVPLFAKPRTGKTKVTLDGCYFNFLKGEIDCAIVFCPNQVKWSWLEDGLKTHYKGDYHCIIHSSGDKSPKSEEQFQIYLKDKTKCLFYIINYEASITQLGTQRLEALLNNRKCFMVVDEAHHISNAKRSSRKTLNAKGDIVQRKNAAGTIIELSKKCEYKWALTGTPIEKSKLDIYDIYQFVYGSCLGFNSKASFLKRYAVFFGEWNSIVGIKNEAELDEKLKGTYITMTKEDSFTYKEPTNVIRNFILTPEQKRYLKGEYDAINENDTMLTIQNNQKVMSMICSGILRITDEKGVVSYNELEKNPKMDLMKEVLEEIDKDDKVIIWTCFTKSAQNIKKLLGNEAVLFTGQEDAAERQKDLERFKAEKNIRYIIMNYAAGSEGLTIPQANVSIMYEQPQSYRSREQAAERFFNFKDLDRQKTIINLLGIGSLEVSVYQLHKKRKHESDNMFYNPKFFYKIIQELKNQKD